ncbi:MAG: oligosaccharide flippase family protein [Pseudomonadales bacterium]|nr:oligosaccharide flippase family protein [Pseudomonadales bacterium]
MGSFFQHKLNRDISWTLGSFVILAVSGIVINLVVAGFRDAAALGVFNQSYAIYIITSQIAVFGIHYSVLRHAAFYEKNPEERGSLLFTSVVMSIFLGFLAAVILFFSSEKIGVILDSDITGRAIGYAAFGLLFFPLNKVLLSYLNGLRYMKAFSILQASRYVLVMLWVAIVATSDMDFALSTLGFFVAESSTVVLAVIYLIFKKECKALKFNRRWVSRHFSFGAKGLLAGMFVEMNSRIDVLLIGFFLSDELVGIYSFAAMLVDGLYHVLAMVRINFNPVLVGCLRDYDWSSAQKLLRKSKILGYPATLIMSILISVAFWVLTSLLIPEKGLASGIYPLTILLAGLTIISAYIPFDNLLMVSGRPGWQTFQHMTVVVSNVILNLSLVPIFGLAGAALATASSYIVGTLMLMFMVDRLLKWKLWNNQITS